MKGRGYGAGLAVCVVAVAAVACSGFGDAGATPEANDGGGASSEGGIDGATPSITGASGAFELATAKVRLVRGRSTVLKVTVARNGAFAAAIDVTLSGAPPGLTAKPLRIEAGQTTGDLELTAAADLPQGDVTGARLEGSAPGAAKVSAPLVAFIRGASGELDTTFAAGGKLEGVDAAVSAFDPTGRFYVARNDAKVVRYTADGVLDPTFTMAPIGLDSISGLAVHQQRVLVCGKGANIAVARLLETGAVDPTYAVNGIAQVPQGTDFFFGCFLSPAGNAAVSHLVGAKSRITWIDAAGSAGTFSEVGSTFSGGSLDAIALVGIETNPSTRLARVTIGKSLDTGFGSGGFVDPVVRMSQLVPTGGSPPKVIAVGKAAPARYFATDGKPDGTFSAPAPANVLAAVGALQGDGKLVVAYQRNDVDLSKSVVRYLPAGAIDVAFAEQGMISIPGAAASPSLLAGFGIQPDGRIVVVSEPTRRYWAD